MILENALSSLVIQNQALGHVLEFGRCSKLGTIGAAVEHEGAGPASLAGLSPQVGHDTSGSNLADVIERQFNGYGTEVLVRVEEASPSL